MADEIEAVSTPMVSTPITAVVSDSLEQYTQVTSDRLAQIYVAEAGVELIPEIIALIGPILMQIITTLLAACPRPLTPANLAVQASRPSLIYRIALVNHTNRVLRQHPEVDINPAAARAAILGWSIGAGVQGATHMLALTKAVN